MGITTLLLVLDLVGVFVFALTGALVGVRHQYDIVGVLVLAGVTALGGGVIRDLILNVPPAGIADWRLVSCAAAAGLLGFYFSPRVSRLSRSIALLDSVGLAVFAVSGTLKGLDHAAPALTCVLVGVSTAVGGGILRDVLSGRPPQVFRGQWYAAPAALGATIVVVTYQLGVLSSGITWLAALVTLVLRLVAIRWRLEAPQAPQPNRR